MNLANLVDELIAAAAYRESCRLELERSDGYYHHNSRSLELADRELQECRQRLLKAAGEAV